jgi:hypothetical protein
MKQVAETLERIEAGLIKLDCYRKIAILSFRC